MAPPDRQLALPLAPRTRQKDAAKPRARRKAERPSSGSRSAAPSRSAGRIQSVETRHRLAASAADLADQLARLLDERVKLTVTDNTSTMVSFRRNRSFVAFRVHQMFVDAPAEVVHALAEYASKGRRTAGSVIDAFVRANEDRVRRARAARQARGLDPIGRHHDLQAMFDDLNARYFRGAIEAGIGWGREAPDRRRRSIKMGTYFHDAKVIRIHPALDRVEVPDFFVRFVVFHEMLHQAVPPKVIGGRRVAHSPEFRRQEEAYPEYQKALAWERRNLHVLLGEGMRRQTFDLDDPLA